MGLVEITWDVAQKKKELYWAQELLTPIKTVLEIGTFHGGTSMLWAKMVGKEGKVFTLDVENFPKVYEGLPEEKVIIRIEGNSHSLKVIKRTKREVGLVDFLFIDGDHTFKGVKTDFHIYSRFVKPGGYIAFHDIVDMTCYNETYGVHKFWEDIKDKYQHWEFIDDKDEKFPINYMGIGVIRWHPAKQ